MLPLTFPGVRGQQVTLCEWGADVSPRGLRLVLAGLKAEAGARVQAAGSPSLGVLFPLHLPTVRGPWYRRTLDLNFISEPAAWALAGFCSYKGGAAARGRMRREPKQITELGFGLEAVLWSWFESLLSFVLLSLNLLPRHCCS